MNKILKQISEQINIYGASNIPFIFLCDFEMKSPSLFSIDEAIEAGIHIQFPNFNLSNFKTDKKKITLDKQRIPLVEFENSFNQVIKALKYGNSFLCNLTCSTHITCNATLPEIYNQVNAKYKILVKDEWLCFSPEIFVQIKNNQIATYPMKGTIDADLENAEQIILSDPKEKAEHYTIVDLLRNDLSIVSKNVRVEKFRYIDTIKTNQKTLLQVSSKIVGDLDKNWQENLGTILFNLLPAGSISGAPKQKTLEIIKDVETHQRGFYTGIAVYFDGQTVDSCVLIRFIENTKKGLVYKSGGGITHQSNVQTEYTELNNKIYLPL